MNRRNFLATTAAGIAGIAGCHGSPPAGNGDPPSTDHGQPTATETPPQTTTGTPTQTATATPSSQPLATVWRQPTVNGKATQVTLSGDTHHLFVATDTGELLGIATADGTVAWRQTTRKPVGTAPALDVFGDTITVVGGDTAADSPYTTLTVRTATTGAVRWFDRRREFLLPLGVRDGALYVSGAYIRKPTDELGANEAPSRSGRVRAYNLADGSIRTEVAIDSSFDVTLAPHGVYVRRVRPGTDGEHSVVGYDLTLSKRWQLDTESQYATDVVTTDRGVIYPYGKQLVHWDAESGDRLWTVTGFTERPVNPTRLPDGTIYAGAPPIREIAPDGTVRQTLSSEVYGEPRPAPSDGAVYFIAGDKLTRVNRATGDVMWSFRPTTSNYVHLIGLLVDAVIVNDDIGLTAELIVLTPETGKKRGIVSVGATAYYDYIAADRLYVGTNTGITAFENARAGDG